VESVILSAKKTSQNHHIAMYIKKATKGKTLSGFDENFKGIF